MDVSAKTLSLQGEMEWYNSTVVCGTILRERERVFWFVYQKPLPKLGSRSIMAKQ